MKLKTKKLTLCIQICKPRVLHIRVTTMLESIHKYHYSYKHFDPLFNFYIEISYFFFK